MSKKVHYTRAVKILNNFRAKQRLEKMVDTGFISYNRVLSYLNYYRYIVLTGARDYGKTYTVMRYLLNKFLVDKKQDVLYYWFRLTPVSVQRLLRDNCKKLIDAELRRWFKLKPGDITSVNSSVYIKGKLFMEILPLSTFFNDKGLAFFDPNKTYRIVCDEFNRESGEKKTFDICKAFFGQLENVSRDSKTSKVFMLGNNLTSVSDLLLKFKFIPHKTGIFKLRSKYRPPALIINFPNSEKYYKRRKNSALRGLIDDDSAFTNKLENYYDLVSDGRLTKPEWIIHFGSDRFTLWEGNIICKYKKEDKPVIAMRPFIENHTYDEDTAKKLVVAFRRRAFKFDNLVTQKKVENLVDFMFPK